MAKVLGYVFIEVEANRVPDVVEAIATVDGVTQAHAVTGRYDVVAQIEGKDFAELATMVLSGIRTISGVRSSETALVIPEPRKEL